MTRTLDASAWSPMFDEVDGGFFRYAAGRDFTRPHTEKLLEDQASIIPVLLDAARTFGRAAYRERAIDVIRFVQRTLSARPGGFLASQGPDEEFYAVSGSIRASMQPPSVDRTLFADLNAQAIAAWIRIAEMLGDPGYVAFALASVNRILQDDDVTEGVAHWPASEAPRNLLTDQVHAAWALIHIARATADRKWLERAEKLMRTTVQRFWDERAGGFLDRVPGSADEIGLLRDPVKPLRLNSLAARVLWKLASVTGDDELRVRARQTLGALTGTYRAQGLSAAPYAVAVAEILS